MAGLGDTSGKAMVALRKTGPVPPGRVKLYVVMLAIFSPSTAMLNPARPSGRDTSLRGFLSVPFAVNVMRVDVLTKTPMLVMFAIPGVR